MLLLNPELIILDETDSGLDIDALKIVSNGINEFRNKKNSFILITHYNIMHNIIIGTTKFKTFFRPTLG